MTELTFKGKEFVYNHHLSVPFRPLVPHADKGIGEVNLDGNLIIQGDNLHALKALLPRYAGKVDCIFIDPPYNTGNEGWAYNDNVNAPMIKEWLQANPIGIEDGLRHDKWCAMMWPRLRLLHELLAETGSIWITLDDNEAHRAIGLLNEIFGEENHIATICWKKKTNGNNQGHIPPVHDFVIVFAKNSEVLELNPLVLNGDEEQDAIVTEDDTWTTSDLSANHVGPYFPIENKATGQIHYPPKGRYWVFNENEVLRRIDDGRIIFGKSGKHKPVQKVPIKNGGVKFGPPSTWWAKIAYNSDGMEETGNILGKKVFDHPKPVKLLEEILKIATRSGDIVLDSFAGSGTTAHAVLSLNAADNLDRNFIVVQMEEKIKEGTPAWESGYRDVIEMTAERARRVIKGYDYSGTHKTELMREKITLTKLRNAEALLKKVAGIENLESTRFDEIEKEVKDGELIVTGKKIVPKRTEGLGGTFTYCTLGEPIELDAILTGKELPSYDALGSVLYHMATNRTLESSAIRQSDFHLGEHGDQHVWLIYKPELEWLKGPDAALTLSFARKIAKDYPDKDHLVFAASRFVSEKLLGEEGLRVEFVPLPFALYRIEKS